MAKKPTPAPASKEVAVNDAVIAADFDAANALALATREAEARTRAVATQLGYQLPADCTDPDLIQRDIAANMRRSVEACLQVGQGLEVLKASCEHGEFLARLEVLGIEVTVAKRFRMAARKFSKGATSHLLKAAGNQSKLLEMLVLDDEQIEELELTGQTGELSLDDIATMSVKELRAALREERQERQADQQLLEKKNAKIDQLERDKKRIAKLPANEELQALMAEATSITRDAMGAIRGGVRAALTALQANSDDNSVLMAGLVGQIQADLNALREEFNLPDVSTAAYASLAEEVAQWAK